MTARAARSRVGNSRSAGCATNTASGSVVGTGDVHPLCGQVLPHRFGHEQEHRAVQPLHAQVLAHAEQRREHLLVRDVEADGAQALGEPRRRLMAAVGEDREPAAGRSDPREHFLRSGLHVRLVSGAVDERSVHVEDDRADPVKHGAATRCGRRLRRRQVRDLLALGHLAQEPDDRVAGRPDRGGGVADRPHRVHLLCRHDQPQQQLLVGDPLAEARPVDVQRLQVAQLLRPRERQHLVGDLGRERGGGLAVVAEEVPDRLVGDVHPALAVDHVPRRLRGDELGDRRDDDRVAHLRAYPADLLQHRREQLGAAQVVEHPAGGRDHSAGELVVVVGGVELLRLAEREAALDADLAEVLRHRGERLQVEPVREALRLEVRERGLACRVGRSARERLGRRVQHLEAGAEALHVDEGSEPDRAVAVQLDRPVAGGARGSGVPARAPRPPSAVRPDPSGTGGPCRRSRRAPSPARRSTRACAPR